MPVDSFLITPMFALAQISLNAIYDWWNLAWGGHLNPNVLWWKHDQLFLLGAFIFEDLAVTAYQVLTLRHERWFRVYGCSMGFTMMMSGSAQMSDPITCRVQREAVFQTVVHDTLRVLSDAVASPHLKEPYQ